jgi:D-alanyl-D-alanine carboxypeptidase
VIEKKEIIVVVIVILLIGLRVVAYAPSFLKNKNLPIKMEKAVRKDPFVGMEVEAKSAVVWDAREDRVLFAKNENTQLPLASLAKIMTARVALLGGGDVAVVTRKAISEEGDSGLLVGEKWRMSDLARLTLVSSSNDGASSLAAAWVGAEKVQGETTSFVETMNEETRSLGLNETYFLNETGLDISPSLSGAYGSAKDIAKLFYSTVAMYPEIFEATSRREFKTLSLENRAHEFKNTNTEVEKTIGIIASKTGFTDIAGGNLAILIDVGINHPIAIVVLGSSERGRFHDIKKLADAAILAVSI